MRLNVSPIMALLSASLFFGCVERAVDEHLVVEGWIEDGGHPVVMVTSSLPADGGWKDRDELKKHVLTLATVSVTCGTEKVFLTGQSNDNYYPPYIYTTTSLTGQAGKKYELEVRYGETSVRASTVIPEAESLSSAVAVKDEEGRYSVLCRFNALAGSHYKFFVRREGKDGMFLSSYLSLVDGDVRHGPVEVVLNRGRDINSGDSSMWFEPGDEVKVRFCTMDEVSFRFWSGYEETGLLSRNPIFPVATGVHSNVEGGYGCWCGYGAAYYTVSCN